MQCTLCDCIVDRPVEAPCRQLVCAECISRLVRDADLPRLLQQYDELFYPSCRGCDKGTRRCDDPFCSVVIELKHLAEHVKSGCKDYMATLSPSELTVQQILSRPFISPLTAVEQTDGTVSNLHECLQMHIQIHIRGCKSICGWLQCT